MPWIRVEAENGIRAEDMWSSAVMQRVSVKRVGKGVRQKIRPSWRVVFACCDLHWEALNPKP